MPAKKYHVALTEPERTSLELLLHRGQHSTRKLTRARILLKADAGLDDETIADEVQTSRPTVERTRHRFSTARLAALDERPRPGRTPKLDEKGEARLIAEACSPDEATLQREVAAWEQQRNAAQETIDWRFSITDAREKLKRLYPSKLVR